MSKIFSGFRLLSEEVIGNIDNRHCVLKYQENYCKLISSFTNEFDCVIINERDRVNRAKIAFGP